MSAFICNHSHITALAVYAARNRIFGRADMNQIGEMLHAENVKSVNYRYGEATRTGFAVCEWAAFHVFSWRRSSRPPGAWIISPASIPAGRRATPAHCCERLSATTLRVPSPATTRRHGKSRRPPLMPRERRSHHGRHRNPKLSSRTDKPTASPSIPIATRPTRSTTGAKWAPS